MLSSSSPSGFIEESSASTENESITAAFTDANICGEGATCLVYQMNLQGLHVAVKRLRSEYFGYPTHEAAFSKEYNIGRQLKHDGLPVYRDMREDDNNVYIIMDFVDGKSVRELLATEEGRRYFRKPENVRRFLSELVGVVGYLHRKGIIHCDIKPDNIMLRHSDMGVMLIDLDKAYSDTLDTTHGGTSEFSHPVKSGEKPTARKDFTAIGKVVDYIAENTPHFPGRKFRCLRRECDNLETTSEKLIAALRPKSCAGIRMIMVVICISIIAGIGYYLAAPRNTSEETVAKELQIAPVDSVKVEQEHIANPDGQQVLHKERIIVINDFDSRMEKFITQTQGFIADLSLGAVSDREISDMVSDVVESYTSAYSALLTEYKKEHPEAAGIDVELALARASEKSRALSIMQLFTQAARDSIVARNPESHMDD